MNTTEWCLYCDPYKTNPAHTFEKIDKFFSIFSVPLMSVTRLLGGPPKFWVRTREKMILVIFRVFIRIGLLIESEIDETDCTIQSRSLVVVQEARKRGLSIRALKNIFGGSTNYFSIGHGEEKELFECFPHMTLGYTLPIDFSDKEVAKSLLRAEGAPYARGKSFKRANLAVRYVSEDIGFPVVVKPRTGSLSKHTTCCIKTREELEEAIKITKVISKEFIVEEHIDGNVYRITLVDGELVAACWREAPNVSGDGAHTVKELINQKNENPLRGDTDATNVTLHKIADTPRMHSMLTLQGVDLNSILEKNRKIYTHNKVVLACGADIHDITDTIHPENTAIFKRIAVACQVPLVGIDVIAKDISRPLCEQKSAILEMNSMPFIDMHHFPTSGKAYNVAGHLLDYYLRTQNKRHRQTAFPSL